MKFVTHVALLISISGAKITSGFTPQPDKTVDNTSPMPADVPSVYSILGPFPRTNTFFSLACMSDLALLANPLPLASSFNFPTVPRAGENIIKDEEETNTGYSAAVSNGTDNSNSTESLPRPKKTLTQSQKDPTEQPAPKGKVDYKIDKGNAKGRANYQPDIPDQDFHFPKNKGDSKNASMSTGTKSVIGATVLGVGAIIATGIYLILFRNGKKAPQSLSV